MKPSTVSSRSLKTKTKGAAKASNRLAKKGKSPKAQLDASVDGKLLKQLYPLVAVVVRRIARYLPQHVDTDDLHSVGIQGLISAIRRYDPTQGNTFEAYAMLRIRGAILDELRWLDSMTRTARAKSRKFGKVVQELEQHLGRAPAAEEIRLEMGLSVKKFNCLKARVKPYCFMSLDASLASSDDNEGCTLHEILFDTSQELGHDRMQNEETKALIAKRVSLLPSRQKNILAMYYFEEKSLSEIARIYEVSEARICQIHTQALDTLRKFVCSTRYL